MELQISTAQNHVIATLTIPPTQPGNFKEKANIGPYEISRVPKASAKRRTRRGGGEVGRAVLLIPAAHTKLS